MTCSHRPPHLGKEKPGSHDAPGPEPRPNHGLKRSLPFHASCRHSLPDDSAAKGCRFLRFHASASLAAWAKA